MTRWLRRLPVALIAGGLCLLVGCSRSTVIPPGTKLPELAASGWINGSEPSHDDLAGHVLVIDVWAYW